MNDPGQLPVLLVEDDDDVREAIATGLRLAGFDIVEAENGHRALELIANDGIGAIVSDIRMPLLDGRQLLQRVKAIDHDLPVILITGHGDIEQAVDAVRNGAYDFLAKPFASDRLADAVARALDLRRLVLENRQLRATIGSTKDLWPNPLIGTSAAVRSLMRVVERIGSADINLLIEGERGTGKRAVAELLHRAGGGRSNAARFIACDIITEQALSELLLGESSGRGRRPGAMRTAPIPAAGDGTTLILENVDALTPTSQARLLQYLHQPGSDDVEARDSSARRRPRIISTSVSSLPDMVDRGSFRADLFYDLAPVKLEVPPLRARKQDIPAVFAHLLHVSADRFERPVPNMSDAILAHLTNHDWPGNMRELQNFAEQVVLNLGKAEFALTEEGLGLAQRVALFEKEAIIGALRSAAGNVQQSCEKLGIPRKTLYDKIARYQIDLKGMRSATRSDPLAPAE